MATEQRTNKPRPFYRSSLFSTTLLLLVLLLAPEARGLVGKERENLDRFINQVMSCANIQALSLSLVGDGDIVYEKGYGRANPSMATITDRDTAFCLGSSTQAFTSVLLANLLANSGNYTFDTPLSEILGARVVLPGFYRSRFANLKDILGMRTGLSNMDILVEAMGTNRRDLLHMLRYAPEVKNFREDDVFSEIPFALAEDAVKALGGGQTWVRQMRRLFARLGMRDTHFLHLKSRDPAIAAPTVRFDNMASAISLSAFKGLELTAAASSVCASAADMSKWIYFILSKGMTKENEQVMTEDVLKTTYQSVQSRGNGDSTRASGFTQPNIQAAYTRDSNGLGWIKGQYRGFSFVSQDGSLPGSESLTTILHTRNVGVFTAFTGDGGPLAYAAKVLINIYALDLLLHGSPWFDHNSVCQIMRSMQETTEETEPMEQNDVFRIINPVRSLDEYEGTFRNYGFGDVTVKNVSNVLKLTYGELGTYKLHPIESNDTFVMEAEGDLWFTTNTDMKKEKREKGYFRAIFKSRDDDPHDRIESVTIPHFARDMDPEFSRNPVPPRSEDYEQVACRCGACAAAATSASVLAASVLLAMVGRWL